jgi:hypothetical protein
MLLEDLFMFAFVVSISVLIGRPAFKLYRRFVPAKVDPVAEAKERLETARRDREAARLNKEAEHLYEEMLNEELEDPDQKPKEHSK